MRAIQRGEAPHYAFLTYSLAPWRVTDLFIVPGHFFSPAAIEKRPPLPASARRAGWVGSSILLDALSPEARLHVVVGGDVLPAAAARDAWQRFAFLGSDRRARGGWGADVLNCVRTLWGELGAEEFTLQAFYRRFEAELQQLHPGNRNVQAKIRQQLQVLRDGGVLDFVEQGRYRVRG